MKKRAVLVLLTLAVMSLMLSCSGEQAGETVEKPSGKSGKFTIVYTGNIGGKLKPCGCRIPLGGFARRATVIDSIRQDADNVMVVDSGAMLFPNKYLYPPYDVIWGRIAHEAVDVVNETGIDYLNVASYDIAASPDTLLAFDERYPAEWLSANIVSKETGELLFPPDAVEQLGDFKVGVFGFMAEKTLGVDIFEEEDPVRVLDPLETARKEVEKLRGQGCDFIVALAYMDFEKVLAVLEQVDGINVAVVSHTREHTPSSDHQHFQPMTVGNAIAVRCPDGGRVVGTLDIEVANGDYTFTNSEDYMDLRPMAVREKDPTPQQSLYTHTFIDLGPRIDSNEELRSRITEFAKNVEEYAASLGLEYKVQ